MGLVDCHTHTELCGHAQGRPVAYAAEAARQGLGGIILTDHAPAPDGYDPRHRMVPEQFPLYRRWFAEAQAAGDVPVGWGVEADFYPGGEAFLRPWLAEQNFDFVLGAVHYLGQGWTGDGWSLADSRQREKWQTADVAGVWRAYFAELLGLVRSGLFDAIGHFDLPKKCGYRADDRVVREIALPVLDAVAAAGMGIELNTSGYRHPCAEPYPSAQILGWMRERNIPLLFGSDAHEPAQIGFHFADALPLARAAGYTQAAHFVRRRPVLYDLP